MGEKNIFICYSRKDIKFVENAYTQLSMLKHQGIKAPWYDDHLKPGQDFEEEIKSIIQQSNLILIFLSEAFLLSGFIYQLNSA